MKRSWGVLSVVLSLCVLVLSGCGAAIVGKTEEAAASAPVAMKQESAMVETGYEKGYLEMDVSGSTADSAGGMESSVYQDPNAKLIREAELRIQTTDFDKTISALEETVNQMGGYFQNAILYGGSHRDVNADRRGEYIIRVPTERYVSFLSQSGELGYVTYRNESTRNIGEPYYDTQARLKTQKTKQERLLSLLEKAETMEDIISLETALSEVEYEIEQLSSTLNHYDSLVNFAAIRLELYEVYEVKEESGVTNSLGERMAKGVTSSLDNLVDSVQVILIWFSYNFFGLLILGTVVGSGVGIVLRRIRKKRAIEHKDE